MNEEYINYIGYAASIFVVISFLLKDLRKIRFINLIGCLCFVVYGLLFIEKLWPVIIPNALLALVQIYHLIKKD